MTPSAAYFAFTQTAADEPLRLFIVKLIDDSLIKHARTILADRSERKRQVAGTIVRQPAPYNPGWSFHLEPTTVSFFEVAMELCDANMSQLEEGLELPGGYWCPWSSRLIGEVGAMTV